MMDGMGVMMWFSSLLGLLLIVLIVLALFAAVQWFRGEKSPLLTGRGDALEILQKRYAKGEIEKDEYETIRRDIEWPQVTWSDHGDGINNSQNASSRSKFRPDLRVR